MKRTLLAVLTLAVVAIAGVLVYSTVLADDERDHARVHFERYLDVCAVSYPALDYVGGTPRELPAEPTEDDCDRSVDELLDEWEQEGRPDPAEIADQPSPSPTR